MQNLFEKIYFLHSWYNEESLSGPGASMKQTERVRAIIPKLLKEFGINSMLDIPCGDFNWMKEVDLTSCHYTGADIVRDIVNKNKIKYASPVREFTWADITSSPLPKADLIFCRDCFVHFSYSDITRAIGHIKISKSKFLLTTTFTNRFNEDIITGHWRPINLEAPPFSFPKPLLLINENCSEENGRYNDKSLGLWKISDLPLALS